MTHPFRHLCLLLLTLPSAGLWTGCSTPAAESAGEQADAVIEDGLQFGQDAKLDATKDSLSPADGEDGADTSVSTDATTDATDDATDATDGDSGGPFLHLCDPCSASSACQVAGSGGNICLSDGALGSFCGAACTPGSSTCPGGFDCVAVQDPDTGKANPQCRPVGGVCGCSPQAIAAAASTPCAVSNGYGTCAGMRTCKAEGLSLCDAPTPAVEACNGQDDNCNGKTDEIEGKIPCEQTNTYGTCKGWVTACNGNQAVCDALTPKEEACNGQDDDCDGQTDEGMCDDKNPCTSPVCGADGSCGQVPLTGDVCEDGNQCTEGDVCVGGVCKGKKAKCDDGNPCTTDGCGPSGCFHDNSVDVCADDGNLCTADYCGGGTCTHPDLPDGTTCTDDNNVCTLNACMAGVCAYAEDPAIPACADDNNPCTLDVCAAGVCGHVPVPGEVSCTTDNSACTDDICSGGVCAHVPTLALDVTCADDANGCTEDLCGGGTCTHPPVAAGTVCADDGLPCTNDVCQSGACQHPTKAIGDPCKDDGNQCTSDTCQNGTCVHLANLSGQACKDDGNPCTIDSCTKQGGCGHAVDPNKCEIGGACYEAGQGSPGDPCKQCVPGTSQSAFTAVNGVPCEDGNKCTSGEVCQGGGCSGGTPKDCSTLDTICGTHACDKDTGICLVTPKSGPCDDGDVCTGSDHCQGGNCIGTEPDCSAFNDTCSVGKCQGGACVQLPLSGPCDDGDPCTMGDACGANKCVGQLLDCSGLNSVCGTGVCAKGVCTAIPKGGSQACDDQNGCTFNDQCVAGLCTGVGVDCASLDSVCTQGVCDPLNSGCTTVNRPDVTTCSDGDACTLNDHCSAGTCGGDPITCPPASSVCLGSYCSSGKCVIVPANEGDACNDSSTCTNFDVCIAGTCTGKGILDNYEVNNSGTGADLGVKTDCEGASVLSASMSPAQDIDLFHYKAKDDSFCSIYPDVTISNLAADYDLCVWFACADGSSGGGVVGCDVGNYTTGGPNGWTGCCSTNSGTTPEHVRHNDSCSFLGLGDDGGTVVVQVFPKNAAIGKMCGGYNMSWQAK